MPAPPSNMPGDLTGATRYRNSFWSSALILQVEVVFTSNIGGAPRAGGEKPTYHGWRDAKRSDLVTLEWMARRKRMAQKLA